jgi:hypothetical protein
MDVASEPSYVHGASPVPLLGETLGQNQTSVAELGLQDAAETRTA